MNVLEVKNLVKRYGELTAANHIEFEVKKGEVFGLLGPNGAGKTTTIECSSGIREFDEGEIKIFDKSLLDYDDDLYHKIGVQLQETIYQDHIRVGEICELFSAFYEEPLEYDELLETFDLHDKLKVPVSKLSGGQRQKLSITLALIGNPEIVFLDELTTGLDPEARRDMWQYIKQLKEEGRTVVMSTHYMEEAAMLCDRIAIIVAGEMIVCDTVEKVIKKSKLATEITFEMTSEWRLPGLVQAIGEAEAAIDGQKVCILTHDESILTDIILHFHNQNCTYQNLNIKRPTLDDAYLELIGGKYGQSKRHN